MLFIRKTFIESATAAFQFLEGEGLGWIFTLFNTLDYLSIPIIYLWKITVISFVVWVGCFTFGYRVTYKQSWNVVLLAEFIFILPEFLKVIWFMFFVPDPSLFEIRAFYPFSLIQFFDFAQLSQKFYYPLKALNAFEIFYWYLLASGLAFYIRKDIRKAWIVVLATYVPLFFMWLGYYLLIYG
ncbi:MAG TPA: hypothetical protein PKC24_05225 [Cyclobacteriaceae bacterium]|nr:hypothetical protein [Cyclobacteriaceae bacterium]